VALPKLDRRRVNPSPANLIGPRVRDARAACGYSQATCAGLLQEQLVLLYPEISFVLDQSDLSRLETGKRPVWDFEVRCLAVVLGVSTDFLLGLSEQDAPAAAQHLPAEQPFS